LTSATVIAPLCRNFINGRWVESRSGQTIERRNPANVNELVSVAPLSTREEVREAIAAAKAAVADRFVEIVVERARKLKVGNGLDADVDVGPLVDENQLKTVLRYIETGKKEARLLVGGGRMSGAEHDNGYFVAPTVFDHVRWDSVIAQEEIFGPVLSVIRVPDFEEALRVANSVKYGLSSSIYTNDASRIFAFIDRIETGMTHVNAPTVASEAQLPFGGMKATGVGLREMGRVAIDFYTELKAVYIDYTGRKR